MQSLATTEVVRARSVADALALLAQADARVFAGGTDLVPNLRRGIGAAPRLVDIAAIDELARIEEQPDGSLAIGAAVTLEALANDATVAQRVPALAQAALAVAAPQHRAAGTLGGNLCQDTRCIFYNQSEWWRASNGYCLKLRGTRCHVAPQGNRCHAAFCSDLAPVLLVAGARVEIAGPNGTRSSMLVDLYRDDGAAHLQLARGELLTRVTVPPADARIAFGKLRPRGQIDFPLASVAVAASRAEDGTLHGVRVALSGTNSSPVLFALPELDGARWDEAATRTLRTAVQRQAGPMRTTSTPSQYRRDGATAIAARLMNELCA